MKHKLTFFAILMMAFSLPEVALAYDFSYTYQGTTLYYNLTTGGVEVTSQNISYPYYTTSPVGNVVVPSIAYSPSGAAYDVVGIGGCAFWGAIDITGITLPNTITYIGPFAFQSCYYLQSINIPDGVTTIGNRAFISCLSIASLYVPASVTYIGGDLFSSGNNLTSITVDNNNTYYDSRNNCNAIIEKATNTLILGCQNTIIPNSVTNIAASSFEGVSGLTSIVIPDSVINIGAYAFMNSGLNELTIGKSVSNIETNAFNGCYIEQITILAETPPTVGSNALDGIFSHAIPIYVPCGSEQLYSNANYWYLFSNFIPTPMFDFSYDAVAENSGMGYVDMSTPGCDSTITLVAWAFDGYQFVEWNDGVTDGTRIVKLTQDTFFYAIYEPAKFYVQGISSDTMMGVVIGSDTADYLDTVTLTAVPNYGYHFVQWNDPPSSWYHSYFTDNPLVVEVWSDAVYTAYFLPNEYTITVNVDTNIHGYCTGGGSYTYLSERTISATANYGYHFTQWSDGDTNNPRIITLTQDTSFTAMFDKNRYVVTAVSSDTAKGSAFGSDTVEYLDTVTVVAVSNYGYSFHLWEGTLVQGQYVRHGTFYGDTLKIAAIGDIVLSAMFNPDTFDVNLSVDTAIHGYCYQSGANTYLNDILIQAYPYYGYHFTMWNDGITDNPRTITLTHDTTFTAHFAPNQYTLTVTADEHGTATGGGTYDYGDTITIQAVPEAHYHFTHWNDGNTDNPRQYLVEEDMTLTAYFAIDTHTVSVAVNDISRGMVSQSGTEFIYGAPCTVEATPYSGYTFAGWSDGSTFNPYTFAVLEDVELTAIFLAPSEIPYVVSVNVNDPTMGGATVNGSTTDTVTNGTEVTIEATANAGYRFVRWNDNDSHAVRTVVITSDITFTAYFEANVGIDDVAAKGIRVYSCDGEIVLEGSEGRTVSVFDIMGRKVFCTKAAPEPCKVAVMQRGVYLVKIGNLPARKIVVVR